MCGWALATAPPRRAGAGTSLPACGIPAWWCRRLSHTPGRSRRATAPGGPRGRGRVGQLRPWPGAGRRAKRLGHDRGAPSPGRRARLRRRRIPLRARRRPILRHRSASLRTTSRGAGRGRARDIGGALLAVGGRFGAVGAGGVEAGTPSAWPAESPARPAVEFWNASEFTGAGAAWGGTGRAAGTALLEPPADLADLFASSCRRMDTTLRTRARSFNKPAAKIWGNKSWCLLVFP